MARDLLKNKLLVIDGNNLNKNELKKGFEKFTFTWAKREGAWCVEEIFL